jgi:hypothetical protein
MSTAGKLQRGFLESFGRSAGFRLIARLLVVLHIYWGMMIQAQATPTLRAPRAMAPETQTTPLSISSASYAQTAVKRVTRTVFDFTYAAQVVNGADRRFDKVRASLASLSPATVVVDGELTFGTVAPFQTLASQDTFTIRQDRTIPFDPSKLVWIFQANRPPVADAGSPQTAPVGAEAILNGAGSSDPDGDPLSYRWRILDAPPNSQARLSDATAPRPGFGIDKAGQYRFELVVRDGYEDSAPVVVTVSTLNSAPTADAGPDQRVDLAATATLDGGGSSDPDGDFLHYAWSLVEKPADSAAALVDPARPGAADTPHPQFVVDKPGTYRVRLIVNDGLLESAADIVVVGTNDARPVADAGDPQTVRVGDVVTLNGSRSKDPEGAALGYRWNFLHTPEGSEAALHDETAAQPWFEAKLFGDYIAQLVVSDGALDSLPSTVTVTTENSPPIADAGPDRSVVLGETALLDGSASRDPDGDPLSYAWSILHAPDGAAAQIQPAGDARPAFLPDRTGSYVIQLLVRDAHNATATDSLDLTVLPKPNRSPSIVSSPVVAATVGQAYVYDADAVDPDPGDTLAYSLARAPEGMAIDAATGAIRWTPGQTGEFPVEVRATDPAGAFDAQSYMLAVTHANRPPAFVSAPVLAATVGQAYAYDAIAQDPDGDALTYSLARMPEGMAIDAATGAIRWTPASGQAGEQAVEAWATDPGGLSATQSFVANVAAHPNSPPVAVEDAYAVDQGQTLVIDDAPGPGAAAAIPARAAPVLAARASRDFGKVPLHFEANSGQADPQVEYLARGPGYGLFLAPNEAALTLAGSPNLHPGRASANPLAEARAIENPLPAGRAFADPLPAGEGAASPTNLLCLTAFPTPHGRKLRDGHCLRRPSRPRSTRSSDTTAVA